jgi:hypothetical protein
LVTSEERLEHLEARVALLERDLREHWHDITTLQLKDKKGDKTVQVELNGSRSWSVCFEPCLSTRFQNAATLAGDIGTAAMRKELGHSWRER